MRTAGEYWATHAGAGVPQARLDALKARLEGTKAKLEQFQAAPADPAPLAGLGKEDLAGDLLYATVLGYFAANEAAERVEQRSAGAVAHRLPSFGHFGVAAKVAWRYGLPARVSFPGLMMDVDLWRGSAVMKDNDGPRQAAFVRQAGMRLSAYEHLVPEKLWTDAQHPGEAVSAVKALARAAAAGQRIYTLTARNAAALARVQIDAAARAEIGDALAAGKTVTVHERPVTVSGWTGSGYIVADPDTGAGAYKISGGANGGSLVFKLAGIGLVVSGTVFLSAVLAGGAGAAFIVAAVAVYMYTLVLALADFSAAYRNKEKALYLCDLAMDLISAISAGTIVSVLGGPASVSAVVTYISSITRSRVWGDYADTYCADVYGE